MIKELKDLDFRNMIVMNDLGYQPDEYDRKEAAIEMADEKQMPHNKLQAFGIDI